MPENNYIRAKYNVYNSNNGEWELVCRDIFYSVITDIVRVNIADTNSWKAEDYGEFNVHFVGIDGIESSLYVGGEDSYVYHNGVKYEGEFGMYKLMNLIEQEKIQNLLETL